MVMRRPASMPKLLTVWTNEADIISGSQLQRDSLQESFLLSKINHGVIPLGVRYIEDKQHPTNTSVLFKRLKMKSVGAVDLK